MTENKKLHLVAIHEAGHLVVRYLMFGNIDIIKSVDIIETNRQLGRNYEDSGKKSKEMGIAYDNEDNFEEVGGYAYKECCYSIAGCIADKIQGNLDHIPWSNSDEDMESLYSFLGLVIGPDETIDALVEAATPKTEKLIRDNFHLVQKVADALVASPEKELSRDALLKILEN